MSKMRKALLWLVAIYIYLSLGWQIGAIKWDMWHGHNGYHALKDLEKTDDNLELGLRRYFFPITSAVAFQRVNPWGDSSNGERNDLILLSGSNLKRTGYCSLHAIVGPIGSFLWFIMVSVSNFFLDLIDAVFTVVVSALASPFA